MILRNIAVRERENRRTWPRSDCQNEMPARGERAPAPQPSCGARILTWLSQDHGAPAGRHPALTFAWEAAKLVGEAAVIVIGAIGLVAMLLVAAAVMGVL